MSVCSMPSRKHCRRNSGAASTCMCNPSITTWMDARVRLLRGSADVQTAHLQAIIGTPWEVPVPRKTTSMADRETHRGTGFQLAVRGDQMERRTLLSAFRNATGRRVSISGPRNDGLAINPLYPQKKGAPLARGAFEVVLAWLSNPCRRRHRGRPGPELPSFREAR